MSVEPVVCRVTADPIDTAALLAQCPTPEDGAVLLFLGLVRNHNQGRAVGHLEYQAFSEMAEKVMREIVQEATGQWEAGGVALVHRVGRLEIGEASVAIAVSSPHRDAAYQLSRYIIEELKRRVPVWKREGYLEGESEWLAGNVPEPVEERADG